MNPIVDIIFSATWIVLLVYAIRMMSQGWNVESPKYNVQKRTVTKPIHPEMSDVKSGDELMVVNFGEEEPQDPLHTSLQNRIQELSDEIGDEDDYDDEDDDDGGDVVALNR